MSAAMSPTKIRINGIEQFYTQEIKVTTDTIREVMKEASAEGMKVMVKPLSRKKKTFALTLWSAGVMLIEVHASPATALTSPSMWKEILPVFGVFQEISMVIGSLAIITGLIVMIFKKRLGWTICSTAGLVVLGCFLVPSAVMLVAIIGKLLNGALVHAFDTFQVSG